MVNGYKYITIYKLYKAIRVHFIYLFNILNAIQPSYPDNFQDKWYKFKVMLLSIQIKPVGSKTNSTFTEWTKKTK